MKTVFVKTLLTLVVAVFLVSDLPLCVAGDGGVPLIDPLRGHPKLIEPDQVLEDFVQGKATTGVIVNLEKPPSVPGSGNFRDLAFRQQLQASVRDAQDRVISRLDPSHVRVKTRFTYVFGFAAEVTLQGLKDLLEMDEVASINKDRILKPHTAQGIPLMNAETVRSTYNGSGLAIAICDTGIDTSHPALGGGGAPIFNTKVIGGYDTGDDDSDPTPDPINGEAHGTACAGIAAGDLSAVGDYIGGVAHNAKLYAIKISTGTSGSATEANMIEGWEWCITHQNDDPSNPIVIISTSFGGSYFTSPCDAASPSMTAAAANCVAAGMTLFVSSGNEGFCDGSGWPACITHVNAVGAVYDAAIGSAGWCISPDSCTGYFYDPCPLDWACEDASTAADLVTCYSNSADFLSLFAPSNDAYTADIVGAGGYTAGDYTTTFGGTSAACPYAAGAAACLQSWAKATQGTYLTPAEVKSRLTSTGDPITDTKHGNISITKPRVNLGAAVGGAAYTILHKEGALWRAGVGWITTTPPYYPGYPYAVDMEYRPDGTYGILHIDGAIWYSDTGWVLSSPPYYAATGYARDLEFMPGQQNTLIDEDFEGSFPPAGWTVTNNGGNCPWQLNTYWGRDNFTGGTGACADADSDECGPGTFMDTELWTPTFNLSGYTSAALWFRTDFYYWTSEYGDVDVSTNGGANWTNLVRWQGVDVNGPVNLDLTPYCGNSNVMIRFHYGNAYWDYWWEVDDVQVVGSTAEATTILHKDGALWNSVTGWTLTIPPYYAGTDYAVDLEYLPEYGGPYRILHRDGAVFDSLSGVWDMSGYYAGTGYARDFEITQPDNRHLILHQDGALYSPDTGWLLTAPPYYAGSGYARDLEVRGDGSHYTILDRTGALYDSSTGWTLSTPPYYPGSNWTVDLESR